MEVFSKVIVTHDQVSTNLEDEVIILNMKSGIYYGLSSVGARIWTLLQQPVMPSSIRDVLVSEYEVDPNHCEQDVITILEDLEKAGLVEVIKE